MPFVVIGVGLVSFFADNHPTGPGQEGMELSVVVKLSPRGGIRVFALIVTSRLTVRFASTGV